MMVDHLACALQVQSQRDNTLDGPVAILWDIGYCPVPCDVQAESVAGNIRNALRAHPVIKGAVTLFSAYGDFTAFSRRLREGCQRTGVKLVDVPSGRKFATDKAILVDMFVFALDNRPPASILLISGDPDFSPALHVLGQRGYTVVIVVPAFFHVEPALSSAGRFVWDWPTVARGEGFVPRTVVPHECEHEGYRISCQLGDQKNGQNEELLVYRNVPGSKYSIPAKMGPVILHKYDRTPIEFEGAHFSSKCKTPQGLQSEPMEGSKFNGNRWGEQSLQVQSLDIDTRHTKKLKMKRKECSAPAKVNTIFCYRYDPVSKEVNGTPPSSAEHSDCNRVVPNPSSSEVPLVAGKGLWEHAFPMLSLDVDKKLGKKMNEEQNEVGTLASIDPTCKFGEIPHSFLECNNPQSISSEPSEVLPVENDSTQVKLQVKSTNVDGTQSKRRRRRKKKKFSEIPHSLSECDNPQCLPLEPSEDPPDENGLTQVKPQVQSSNVDGRRAKRRRKKAKKQNKYNEPASTVFPFKYVQVPVEFDKTHNTSDYNSLQSLPSNLS